MRHLDGDVELAGIVGPTLGDQPVGHGGQRLAGMLEDLLADVAALLIDEPHEMTVSGPIDAGIPLPCSVHARTPFKRRATATPAKTCTGARSARGKTGADSHWASIAANPLGHMSSPGDLVTRCRWCPRRTGSVPAEYDSRTVVRGTNGVPLRYTPLVPRRLLQGTAWIAGSHKSAWRA